MVETFALQLILLTVVEVLQALLYWTSAFSADLLTPVCSGLSDGGGACAVAAGSGL
jgi:hypothetical protein